MTRLHQRRFITACGWCGQKPHGGPCESIPPGWVPSPSLVPAIDPPPEVLAKWKPSWPSTQAVAQYERRRREKEIREQYQATISRPAVERLSAPMYLVPVRVAPKLVALFGMCKQRGFCDPVDCGLCRHIKFGNVQPVRGKKAGRYKIPISARRG